EKQRFLTDVLHEVMLLDGLASSHPISQEVFEATDIDRVFDWIAYKKAMQREGKDINITQVMDRWTLQMGYPVVTISKNDSLDNSVTISQEHFVYDTNAKIQNPELFNNSFQWQIPLTLAVGNSSHISTETIIWVSNKTETHRVGHVDGETWLLGNINQTGYFRVNYDLHNWRLLIQQLMTNPTIISVGNRAGLIDDVFNLARAGYLPQNVPLQTISYLSQETEFLPWHAASRALYQLDKLLDRTEDHSLFSHYVLRQVEPKYHKLGWPAASPDGSFMQVAYQAEELQREVMMLACSFGNKHCHRQAVSLISDWISSNNNRIPPNVRDIVYCTGVSLMDEDVWEFIWMEFHSSTAISEKKVLLEALTCSDNIFLLNRSVDLINNDKATKFK
ncbi:thyrotropin-releasing hormone-degrading ectoenzyme-like, partial [Sinocyclocheilus anshuiensis]|uniref:thyrotropin-releasing hormone-degrading ectoenzyme-like n=1 Tax=Sinocyclocheilus anshuiensis TaxID=1608454 RepID=UPI0007BA8FAC